MTSPTSEITALARRFAVEINIAAPAGTSWQPLVGVEDLKTVWEQRRDKDENYDDGGAEREAVTGSSWSLEIKLQHRVGADKVTFNSTQEYLRGLAQTDDAIAGEAHVRWYDRSGTGEAWEGRALIAWTPDGGPGSARDMVSLKISGQGKRVAITNPNGSLLPVVYALVPATSGTAGGSIIEIRGRKLTGATAVTVGGTNATNFRVVSDSLIVATAPAKVAGTYDVLVTTPAGTSANTAADNIVYS